MASLIQILSWFKDGLFVDEDKFKQSWTSFWHKSEHLPLSQVLGLTNALNDKASKDDLQNVMSGIVPMGSVSNIAELNTKPKRNNDSYFVLDQTDANGDPYIFRYDAGLNKWVNTEQVIYKNVAKKEDIEFSSVFPYKEGEKGKNIPILKNAIKGLYIYPEYMLDGYGYRIASILRTTEMSQITLYSLAPQTGGLTQVERFQFAGDENNDTVKLYKGLRFSILIDWSAIPLNSQFTNMLNGYELDPLVFSKANPLEETIKSENWKYPYTLGSTGKYVDTLRRAIRNVFIHPHIMETGKVYYLTSVRRNHVNETTGIKETQLAVWSKRKSDGASTIIEEMRVTGDIANGNVQIIRGKTFAVEINWNALNDGSGFTSMFEGYELDARCFSYDNQLYSSLTSKEMFMSRALPASPQLPFNGYVDIRNGNISGGTNFKASDYIKVRKGQKIRYLGNLYGNAGICGYPSKSIVDFVVLHDSSKISASQNHPLNKIVEFEVPDGVNYIRVCVYGGLDFRLEWINTPEISAAESTDTDTLTVKNISVTGGQLHVSAQKVTAQKVTTRWLELSDNYDVPSKGVFIASRGNDIIVSIDGVLKKINLVDL